MSELKITEHVQYIQLYKNEIFFTQDFFIYFISRKVEDQKLD